MRKLSIKGSPNNKNWVFLLLLTTILTTHTFCQEAENAPIQYKFPKQTGAINLEDIQQFDEVNKIMDEDIDLRVKEATQKMMDMTIEDNIDHIDDDIANYDMNTMPKDFGPMMERRKSYKHSKKKSKKKKKSKRSLIQMFTEKKKRRTQNIFDKSKILEKKKISLSKNFVGRPVKVLSLQKGKAVDSQPVSDNSIIAKKSVEKTAASKISLDKERQLRGLHGKSYVNDVYNIIRKQNQALRSNHFKQNKSKKDLKMKRLKRENLRKLKIKQHKKQLHNKIITSMKKPSHKKKSRRPKMHIKILHIEKKKHHHHRRKNRKLMIPGAGGGGGVVVAPNQGAGIANAQVVVNSLGTPATVPYAEGNAVPAYAPEDTAPKVIVTRMKMPSNLPY